jgi:hypothetical protein
MTERHAETLTNNSTNSTNLLTTGVASNTIRDPNAMEVDSIQVALNNINKRFNQLEQTMGRNNNYNNYNNNGSRNNNSNGLRNNNNISHPPPLTREEREWCNNNNACRRCRQPGHFANRCPIYGNNNNRDSNGSNGSNSTNNRQGRWVYQVAVGDSPESGKASDDQA